MAKKKSTARKKAGAKKKSASRPSRPPRKTASKKKTSKRTTKAAPMKTGAKKSASKKSASKKTTRKAAKKASGRTVKKKSNAKKAASKKTGAKKKTSAKSVAKKSAARKSQAKKATTKKTETTKKAPAKAPESNDESGKDKPNRKGITIVSKKPVKKRQKQTSTKRPELGGGLLSGNKKWKPLIPSGPNAAPTAAADVGDEGGGKKRKSPFNKKELETYRQRLLEKRAELIGDVETMEDEALHGSSGGLSHTPQHLAEQGSDTYDQSLSLDLAAADRKLITEIDEALERINEGTYGICVLTGKPIAKERLEELPWARYSIEAAREMERRSYGR